MRPFKNRFTFIVPSALLVAASGCGDSASAPTQGSLSDDTASATQTAPSGSEAAFGPVELANSDGHDDAVDDVDDVSWVQPDILEQGQSMLRLLMTDAPIDAESVLVTFCGVYVERAVGELGTREIEDEPGEEGEPSAGEARMDGDAMPGAGGRDGRGDREEKGDGGESHRDEEEAELDGELIDPEDSEEDSGSERAGWHPLSEECRTLDLLTLRDGVTEALGATGLPPGEYGHIRLMLTEASIVVDGVEHELFVPSGSESGLKIGSGFTLEGGVATTLTIDFDAAKSVLHAPGKGYMMKPVISMAGERRHAPGMEESSGGDGAGAREPGAAPEANGESGRREDEERARGGAGEEAAGGAGGAERAPPRR